MKILSSFGFGCVIVLVFAAQTGAQNWDVLLHSGAAGERFGHAAEYMGDITGDGCDEIIVGAPYSGEGGSPFAGAAYVISFHEGILFSLFGDGVEDQFGHSVVRLGDLTGDGVADFAVGAPKGISQGTGYVRVFSGADGSTVFTVTGDNSFDRFGQAICRNGDLNGDGVPDFSVGAPQNYVYPSVGWIPGSNSGYIRTFSGLDGSVIRTITGEVNANFFGNAMCDMGDLNDDGYSDMAVAAPRFDKNWYATNPPVNSYVSVFSGSDGSLMKKHSATFVSPVYTGSGNHDLAFGAQLASVQDRNGDGHRELVISIPKHWKYTLSVVGVFMPTFVGTETGFVGQVRVLDPLTGTPYIQTLGTLDGQEFGTSLGVWGDGNNNGVDEILVADKHSFANVGSTGLVKVRILSNGPFALNFSLSGRDESSRFGSVVRGDGDFNGDGNSDIFVGIPRDDSRGFWSGSIEIFVNSFSAPYVSSTSGLPQFEYESTLNDNDMNLAWRVERRASAIFGSISCDGASSFASGIYAVSLAPADYLLAAGFSLLVAPDNVNFLGAGLLAFDAFGEMNFAQGSRRVPGLAGMNLHIQFFELSPVLRCSNGLKLPVAP